MDPLRLQVRDEVHRRRTRLQQLFKALDCAGVGTELTSHYARYLCMLVSGYAEQSVKELVRQYCRKRSSEAIQKYVGSQLKRMNSIDKEKITPAARIIRSDLVDRG